MVKKAETHSFWTTSSSSVGASRWRSFVRKADYDLAIKKIQQLEKQLKTIKNT
jgi:hypothetical protein